MSRNRALSMIMLALMALLSGCDHVVSDAGADPGFDATSDLGEGPDDAMVAAAKHILRRGHGPRPVTGFSYVATGTRWIPEQGYEPGDGVSLSSSFTATVQHDLRGERLRIDYTRALELVPIALQYSEIYAGQLGHVVGVDGLFGPTGDMLSTRAISGLTQHRLMNPLVWVDEMLAHPTCIRGFSVVRDGSKIFVVLEFDDEVSPISVWIDLTNGRLARITTLTNDMLRRDVTVDVRYEDWSFQHGVLVPTTVELYVGGRLLQTETRTDFEINPTFGPELDLPSGAAPVFDETLADVGRRSFSFFQTQVDFGVPADAIQTFVAPTEVGPGVWLLAGGSHNSMAVEQENGVVVVDAPLYPERADALIAWIDANIPGKPITHAVSSHHHYDHAGGLRSFVAAGATIVVHEDAVDFYEPIFAAPSTISPDTLEMSPTSPSFLTVSDGSLLTLPDAQNPVHLYPVINGHAADMLLALVSNPADGYLFVADLYLPGNGGATLEPAETVALHDAIIDLGLDVDVLVGAHGSFAPLSELDAFLGL